MKTPQYLKKGSKIAIVAPAWKVTPEKISAAVKWIEEKGFVPVYDDRLFAEYNQFAGDDDFRASVLQEYLDRNDIDAIFCARGGYGTIRIIDKLDFTKFAEHPKWIVGFSDVTVLHAKMQQLGYQSIHGIMSKNFESDDKVPMESLYEALTGKWHAVEMQGSASLKSFEGTPIVGGNLSVLYSMLGSDLFPETDGKILFIEDIDEYLYHIDRMMMALKRAGKLSHLKALLVGAFNDMHESSLPIGMTAREIIAEKVKEYGYPVIWDYPAGHIDNNLALVLG
ncbi:MAG: LD-carboxypeptidase [Bacteroidales bacterium]|jgi:muramoyltetrapeptide carboxypeptidase|nr:LD-carboxypeptidase [Bacteroidales bacterium]